MMIFSSTYSTFRSERRCVSGNLVYQPEYLAVAITAARR